MANREILDLNNKILGKYLPSTLVENPMTSDLNGGGFDINNISTLTVNSVQPPAGSETIVTDGDIRCNNILCGTQIESIQPLLLMGTAAPLMGYPDPTVLISGGSVLQVNSSEIRCFDTNIVMNSGANPGEIILDPKTGIVASFTSPDMLELVAVQGATVVVSDKVNTGQVYDSFFNQPSFNEVLTWSNSLQAATQTPLATAPGPAPIGWNPPKDGWYLMSVEIDITGATVTQASGNGYVLELYYNVFGNQAIVNPNAILQIQANELVSISGFTNNSFNRMVYLTKQYNFPTGGLQDAYYAFRSSANNISGGTIRASLISL